MASNRERFRPDPSLSRTEMKRLQREIAKAATFEDALEVTPADVRAGKAVVAGVDQAFLTDADPALAVSAAVALRGEEVLERVYAVTELEVPYVPGLLAFREGGPILAALGEFTVEPDLYLFDGSGRIHFRQAGLATHVGVLRDRPSVGVAKSLLCGEPRQSVEGLAAGERVPIVADADVTAPDGTVLGYAYQSRQFDSGRINPLYVSPGHRMSAQTAVEFVAACGGDYKLPEPTRLADAYADEAKAQVEGQS
ncbi:endonuclease V [Halosegnis sp.]|uniref:endonuclease V n=1 Tax=Halosegnis sp. TaxID=2864959 RepID=UPI0035D49A66